MQGFAYKRYMKACSSHIEGAVKLDLNAMRHEYWRSLTLMDAFGTMHAWAVSSAVRASGLHPEGRVFKSRTAHHSSSTPAFTALATCWSANLRAFCSLTSSREPRMFCAATQAEY